MVPDSPGAEVAALRAGAPTGLRAAAVVVCAVAFGGCFESGSDSGAPAPVAGASIGGSIRDANCRGWRAAGPSERRNTVHDITAFAGGPAGENPGTGATLPDDKAYGLFEHACRNDYARGFKLYKLYTRAAAFGGGR